MDLNTSLQSLSHRLAAPPPRQTSVTEEQSSSSSSSSPAEPSTTPAAEGPVRRSSRFGGVAGVSHATNRGQVPRIAGRAFDGAELRYGDVTTEPRLCFTHIYIFDWVFAKPTLAKVAKVLQASPFYVLVSFRKPAEWWSYGLVKAREGRNVAEMSPRCGRVVAEWWPSGGRVVVVRPRQLSTRRSACLPFATRPTTRPAVTRP